jgi:transposase
MKHSFDSLSGLVRQHMNMSPTDSSVFIFMNRTRNQVKLLHWEGDGFAIYYKRLERGTYELPRIQEGSTRISVTAEQLQFILQGIRLSSVVKRKRYQHFDLKCGLQSALA